MTKSHPFVARDAARWRVLSVMGAGATTVPLVGRAAEDGRRSRGPEARARAVPDLRSPRHGDCVGAVDVFVLLWFVLPSPESTATQTTVFA